MRKSALFAEDEEKTKIEKEHIIRANKEAKRAKINQILGTLNDCQKTLYEIIENSGEITSSDLYKKYKEESKNPIPERTYRFYMDKLTSINLIIASGDVRWRKYRVKQ